MKVAIVGFGSEGISTYNFFKKQGADITIFDESEIPKQALPKDAKFFGGKDAFNNIAGFDKVVRSPGINPNRIHIDDKITSNIIEFFASCPSKNIIGVTASKGKGTISTLIYQILKDSGLKAHLAGNIGVPALDILDDIQTGDIVVLELSSFQLWDLKQSPHVAVVGMIEPDHLEVHADFAEYVGAKANIAKWQKSDDVVIYHPTNKFSEQIASESKGHKLKYNTKKAAFVENSNIYLNDTEICSIRDVLIPGPHNLDNICAAITAAWQFSQDLEATTKAVTNFKGLDHRLQFVKEVAGVKFYNDSIATTPGSVIAAMNSFNPRNTILIVGGNYEKGADYSELTDAFAAINPKHIVFVGKIGEKLQLETKSKGYKRGSVIVDWNMQKALKQTREFSESDDVVVLSPAAASFGDFKNYKERGEIFESLVEAI